MPNQEPAPMFGDVGRQPTPWNPRDRERREAERRSPAPATSALDQQVAEARQELVDASREQCRCGPGADEPCEACERWMEAYAALLTTHRRQVLAEVVEGLQKEIAAFGETFPGYTGSDLERGKLNAVRWVASLRDTKEAP